MRTPVIFLLLTMKWCLAVDPTEPTGEAFNMKMPIIKFEQTRCREALEYFRGQATSFLHEEMQIDTKFVVFEYSFDPKMNDITAKVHAKLDYSGKDVTIAEAMSALLHRYGLTYKIVSPTKVIILDKKPELDAEQNEAD